MECLNKGALETFRTCVHGVLGSIPCTTHTDTIACLKIIYVWLKIHKTLWRAAAWQLWFLHFWVSQGLSQRLMKDLIIAYHKFPQSIHSLCWASSCGLHHRTSGLFRAEASWWFWSLSLVRGLKPVSWAWETSALPWATLRGETIVQNLCSGIWWPAFRSWLIRSLALWFWTADISVPILSSVDWV